jgi:glucokinase
MILCLESGGTKLVAAKADLTGRIIRRMVGQRAPDQTAITTLDQLVELGREVLEGIRPDAVSLGFGGIMNRRSGLPERCYHEDGWEGLDAPGRLRDSFDQARVFIENDCNLAALAEARKGVGCPDGTLLYLTMGTGIGGGVVRRGVLLELGTYGEIEIGHCVVKPQGVRCPCGNHGCLETVCSGPGLAHLALDEFGADLDSHRIMQGLSSGRPLESAIADRAAALVAGPLAVAINMISPDVVVFGGGMMEHNPAYLKLVADRTRPQVFPPFREGLAFHLSELRKDVVCQGAALWAIQNLPST